jgi:hypothetical protein
MRVLMKDMEMLWTGGTIARLVKRREAFERRREEDQVKVKIGFE